LRGAGRFAECKSEREWIPIMMETADRPRKLILKLDVHEGNIEQLEAMSCDEIFAAQERLYKDEYARLPDSPSSASATAIPIIAAST